MHALAQSLVAQAGSTLDAAVAGAVAASHRRRKSRIELLSHDDRLRSLADVAELYGDPRYLSEPATFFGAAPVIDPRLQSVRTELFASGGELAHGFVVDASWHSSFEPRANVVRARYLADGFNHTGHARLFLHDEVRPAVVLVHGYLGGAWALEEMVWPIRWLFERGLDVALFVLPFHGRRGDPERVGPPPFPAADPRMTIEAFAQSIFDLRGLIGWLRARGAPHVGVMGMSLGGYTVSLLGTVDEAVDFLVPIIPLASIADLALSTGRLGSRRERPEQHRALDTANRVISPLARPSLVPSDRVLVFGAEGDRITTLNHAVRIAHHFAADLLRFPGSHLLHVGIGDCYRELGARLSAWGITEFPRTRTA